MKRMLCAILAVLMMLSLFPVTAQAAATGHPDFPNNPPADVDTVKEKVDWIAQKCRETGLTDEWEIALWLHDWLIYNANYDYTYTYYYPDGVLLKGTGVCDSYTQAYNLLLNEFNIECKRLSSEGMDHAWNLVKIDGQWCHVDVTWDDPGEGGHECHTYFGMNYYMMKQDHVWNAYAYPESFGISGTNYYTVRMGCIPFADIYELHAILDRELTAKNTSFGVCYTGPIQWSLARTMATTIMNSKVSQYGVYDLHSSDDDFSTSFTMNYEGMEEGHIHDYRVEIVPATCTEDGGTVRRCSCEGYYVDSYAEALGHDYQEVISAPSCTKQGCTTYTCANCGDSYADSYVDALGHKFEDGICTVCGRPESVPGDVDLDGDVDVDDVLALLWHVLFPMEYPIQVEADFDGNGTTDVDDVLTLLWHVLFPEEYPL